MIARELLSYAASSRVIVNLFTSRVARNATASRAITAPVSERGIVAAAGSTVFLSDLT
jgi:hypothetical protein